VVEVSLVNFQRKLPVNAKRLMKLARRATGRRKGKLSIAVVGRKRMAALNKRFKGRSGLTDVLAFDLGSGGELDGEVVVCSDVAAREAKRRGTNPSGELALYVLHGVLHLMGMNDDTVDAARRMHRKALRLLHEAGWRDVE